MKKAFTIGAAVVLVVAIAGGGYLVLHKSAKPTHAASQTASVPPVNNAVLTTKTDPNVGQYLADPSGKPLYTYGADSTGVSKCTGGCLAEWPAYAVQAAATNLPAGVSTLVRTDNGQTQYTYNGMPLYYFADDSAGHVTGNNKDNFMVAKPSAATSSQSSPAPSTSAASGSSTKSNNNASGGYPY